MKRIFRFALGGLLAVSTGHALALTPADIGFARGWGGAVDLYVVTDEVHATVLENAFKVDNSVGRICQPGSLDIYYYLSLNDAHNSSGDTHWARRRALTCRAGFSGTGVTSGSSALILHITTSLSAASNVGLVARGEPLDFLDVLDTGASNLATACGSVTGTGSTLPFGSGSFNTRDCGYAPGSANSTVNSVSVAPNAGIANIDPALLVGLVGLTDGDVGLLTRKRSALAVTYNPIVSVPLFTALQRAYGYIGDTASENIASLDAVPSLPNPLLRGVFNGSSILNASEVNVNGVKLSTKLATPTGSAVAYDASGEIYICRRGDTSDDMASFKMQFMRQGCSKQLATTVSFVNPDQTGCATSGCIFNSPSHGNDFVFAGTWPLDVQACVNYHSSQGRLAIGVANTAAKPSPNLTRYRYIKVGDVEPTLKAVMEGRYELFTEDAFYDKFPGTSVSGAQTLWDALYSSVGNAGGFDVVSATNFNWRNSAALLGSYNGEADTGLLRAFHQSSTPTWLATVLGDSKVTGSEARFTPANPQTRQGLSANRVPNNCNLPYQAYP